MAIKGLTDQDAALPRIGILRKGKEKTSKNAPGRDLTYFRFVPEDDDAKVHFEEAYPDEDAQRCINIFLPYKTPEENFINNSWIEKWVAGGLEYRSDGENIIRSRMSNGQYTDEVKPDPKPKILEDGKREDGSSQVGRLTAIIPELGRLATVTILTTSKNDVANLSKQLKSYYNLYDDLRGIPFIVVRRKKRISTPMGNGERGRRESWLLCIETKPQYTRLYLADVQQKALPAPTITVEAEHLDAETPPDLLVSPMEETEPEESPTPTFASIDDLLHHASEDFVGLSEEDAKKILKDQGYETFTPSRSAEMYKAIELHCQKPMPEDSLPF
jgi:hypothetical protein